MPAPACARSAPRSTATTGSELHILLTHLHLDHLQGLGFFQPLFQPGTDVHIWGPPSPVQTLAERIAIYLSPPLFPVRLVGRPGERHLPRRRPRTASRSARRWFEPAA